VGLVWGLVGFLLCGFALIDSRLFLGGGRLFWDIGYDLLNGFYGQVPVPVSLGTFVHASSCPKMF
jgi:hypothetical protein